MQITTEKLEENQLLLNVQVEEELVEKSLDQAYRRLIQKTNIPGFRRGKAPRSMVERLFGRTALMEDALEHLVPELYQKAIDEQGIQPLAQPKLEIVQVDPVIFKAVIPLPPVVELADYRQISATLKEAMVSEEEVQAFLEETRRDSAPWEPAERPAKMGDLLTLDIKAEEEGKTVLEREAVPYVMAETSKEPAPELAEHLRGLEKGEARDFRVTYSADYKDEVWAGKRIDFHVQVGAIKEKTLPALDDEFAKGIGDGFENLEALRQHLRSRMEEQARRQAQQQLEEEVLQAVVAGARLDFPPVLANHEVDILLNDLTRRFEAQGISLSQYLKFTNKSEEEIRDDLLPRAKERVKRRLVLNAVAEAEGIAVASEEVDTEIEKAILDAVARKDELRAALNTPGGRASIDNIVRTRKTIARLVDFATAKDAAADVPVVAEGASQGEGEST